MQRIRWVDDIRGIAIVLMVIFHFCYDLRYFGYVDWNVPNGPFWWQFRYVILTLFIFTLGVSLTLAHGRGIRWRKFCIRFFQILAGAGAITLMSLYLFPNAWIYFGILHFLALASLLALPFVQAPIVSFATGLLVLLLYWFGVVDNRWPFDEFGFSSITEDYVPLFPWLGVALLGAATGAIAPQIAALKITAFLPAWVGRLGRHGLIIYLVHQPILFALFYLLAWIGQG